MLLVKRQRRNESIKIEKCIMGWRDQKWTRDAAAEKGRKHSALCLKYERKGKRLAWRPEPEREGRERGECDGQVPGGCWQLTRWTRRYNIRGETICSQGWISQISRRGEIA